MEQFKIALWVVIAVLFIIGTVRWSAQRDEISHEQYAEWEECVKREYNSTPAAWYAEYGEYPTCPTE